MAIRRHEGVGAGRSPYLGSPFARSGGPSRAAAGPWQAPHGDAERAPRPLRPRGPARPVPAPRGAAGARPFVWHEGLQAHVASGHAQVSAALRDRRLGRLYRDREPAQDWATFNWLHADSILDSEPPKHTRLRRLVAGAFGRGHVARLEPRIRAIAEELADAAGSGPSTSPRPSPSRCP
ncbi:cytochrome P450 [Janibacter melonis]|uniref:cytochrome P450 n=1 Tax=Janibacter melonis TaxID=262209 RepID=UPI002094BDBF|nr:cytochrome P450 [Janibacter melonis]